MGGSVALTIREPDGKEHRMEVLSRALGGYIHNLRIYQKDLGLVRKIQQDADELIAFETRENMQRAQRDLPPHEPFRFLAPSNYGLTVVDMAQNYILHYQACLRPCEFDSFPIMHEIFNNGKLGIKPFESPDEFSEQSRFKRLWETGRIRLITNLNEDTFPLEGKTLEEITKMIQSDRDSYFPLDTSPFKVETFPEYDFEGAKAVKARILELGFKLTPEEERIWEKWIREETKGIE